MLQHIDVLLESPIFSGLSADEIKQVISCLGSNYRRYEKNESILHAGNTISSFGIVLSGRVHIFNDDFWGNRNIVADAEPGDIFAESYACTDGAVLDNSVVAAEDTEVLFIAVKQVITVCPSACSFHIKLIKNLLSVMAEKNIRMNRKLTHLTRRTTRDKLLSFLSAESARQGSATFEIPFNRQQLADYLSIDRSAMSAELGRMRDEGLLEFNKNRFTLTL